MPRSASASKIAFLIQGHTAPSTRVRILNLLPFLHAAGFQTTEDGYPNSFREWRSVAPNVAAAEIVVIQKRLPSLLEGFLLKLRSRRLVFDFDDSVWLRNREGDATPSNKLKRRFAHFMNRVNLAICGNPILEKHLRETCSETPSMVIPSAVPSPGSNFGKRINSPLHVGWVGTAINLPYLVAIERALIEAHGRVPFELVVLCSAAPPFREFRHFEFIPWSAEREYDHIGNFDVGIMPLADNEHSRGKCAYKALQYMRCGVPVVASDVGINREWIEKPGAGIVIAEDGWVEALVALLANAETRARMGKCGLDAIRGGFRQEDAAGQYIRAFRGLLAENR